MEYRVTNRKILIVEDESALRNEIANHFSKDNKVFTAVDVDGAVAILKSEKIDAVILDLVLQNSMGLDVFKKLSSLPPVIILSTLDSDDQIYHGLTAGAVDYIVKPCSLKILETRVALRLLPPENAVHAYGDFVIDAGLRTVKYRNSLIPLTSSEFNVLYFLVSHRGTFFTSDDIYESVWGAPSLQTATIRRHLSALRRKLKAVTPSLELIQTEFGRGYAFIAPTERDKR